MKPTRSSKLSVADLRDPTRFPKSDYIGLLYKVMLRREPDAGGLRNYSCREDTQNFFREILVSNEFREVTRNTGYFAGNPAGAKRVLLLGAYGNGNLGDAIQANSLLNAVKRTREDIEVWACSELSCQFPFPFEYVLPSRQIYNPTIINCFDLVIIGGGGLLSHPHDPLTSEEWQCAIDAPIVLFGIGAGADVAGQCKTLIAKAIYASGRDDPSIRELKKYRSDIHFVPDPVLADPSYDISQVYDRQYRESPKRKLWVIKKLQDRVRMGTVFQQINPNDDDICLLEPSLDFSLLDIFPSARPIYFAKDFLSLVDQAAVVISMRYHGCILAMLRQKPTIGLFEQKSLDLLARYHLENFFSKTGDISALDCRDYIVPRNNILADREVFSKELREVLSHL